MKKFAILTVLLFCSVTAVAGILIENGGTSNIIYFVLRNATTGVGETGLAHGDATMSYVEQGAALTAVDEKAVAVDADYDSGGFVEVDSTNAPGLYRTDFPDAAFDGGIGTRVQLCVKATGVYIEYLEAELSAPVQTVKLSAAALAEIKTALEVVGGYLYEVWLSVRGVF